MIQLLSRRLVIRDSGLAGLLLWIPMEIGRKELDGHAMAYTDGHSIFFCDGFFTSESEYQYATIIHEAFHIALQHPRRFRKLIDSQGEDEFNIDIANMCADAIVIRAIKHCSKIGPLTITPNYVIQAEDIVDPEDLKTMPPQMWSFEMLYWYLSKKAKAAMKKFMEKHGGKCDHDLQGDFKYNIHKNEVEGRIWTERFKRAQAGSEPGSLLRSIPNDLPEPKVPWQKHFREFLSAHVLPTTMVDWSRPSRRMLASRGKLGYYEPGIQRELGVRTAGICIDTSGSIDEATLNMFIAETNSIMEQTGCNVVVVVCDAAVQSVQRFQEAITNKFEAKGGGGTDFRPALAELEKHDIDCCVYLTDMMGTFPDRKPPFPVMWAVIGNHETQPPFGKLVKVEDTIS